MKIPTPFFLLLSATWSCPTIAASTDPLCAPLQAFVASVGAQESRDIEFRTSWGSKFKDEDSGPVLYSKRCVHDEYPQAKVVCDVLMEHGLVEFSGHNAKDALQCLSPDTKLAPGVYLETGEFSFNVGTDDLGQNVTNSSLEDPEIGGMVLRITADGY